MRTTFQCGDNAALVSYLYDECEPDERAAIGAHLAVCVACAAEMAALQSTRIQLASWSPPETELGFVIARAAAPSAPDRWRPWAWFGHPLPAWARLAGAVAIFAAGVSLGIARGTMREAPASVTAAAPATVAAPAASVTAASLDALERRLRGEMARLHPAADRPAATPAPTLARGALSDAEGQLLARVRALIDESEQRQQRELALRTAQIVGDFDSQRRVDLEQIQRTFGQIEGLTGAEVREQRQMLNYLMRVSQQQ
ncbi:MAG: hypothetical protein HYU37_04130 [Acidobacteria bacterium]|nr:hypothetical protein [Acidobacteriota bacterium]